MTEPQRRTLQDVLNRAKGWPVGIPVPKRMARRLVSLGYAEWAPPMWSYPKPVHAIRLTTSGEVGLKLANDAAKQRKKLDVHRSRR